MDQTRFLSLLPGRPHGTTRRSRVVRAALVSALCAVMGAGFIVGPRAASQPSAATHAASHVIAQASSTDTLGGPGSM